MSTTVVFSIISSMDRTRPLRRVATVSNERVHKAVTPLLSQLSRILTRVSRIMLDPRLRCKEKPIARTEIQDFKIKY